MVARDELNCQELVELVTDYLEGALPLPDRARFDVHIGGCGKCATYLDQMRETIRLTRMLTEESVSAEARQALLAAFRGWKAG